MKTSDGTDIEIKCAFTELVDVYTLQPNPKNPNQHPEKQIELLTKIIRYSGFRSPIVVSKRSGFVVKGHARLLAAKLLNMEKAPVDYQDYKDEAQEYADMVADNAIAEMSSQDLDMIKENVLELQDHLPSLDMLGIPDFSISIDGEMSSEQLDAIPEDSQVPSICKNGDVWKIGDHLLACGDSTNSEFVQMVIGSDKANLVMTSPPYWIGKQYETEKTESDIDSFIKRSCAAIVIAASMDFGRIVINTGLGNGTSLGEKNPRLVLLVDKWVNNLASHGWIFKNLRFWVKAGFTAVPHPPSHDYVIQGTEFLMNFYNPNGQQRGQNRLGSDYHWTMQCNFDDISGDRGENTAGFPVELPSRFIKLYTIENEVVFEPFCGNGTTLIACENLKRRCIAIEKLPHSCDVTIKRWSDLTGNKAVKLRTI